MSAPSHFKLGYRPALDGIRGIGIALVVVLHWDYFADWNLAGADSFVSGGFIAVDVFFVLSGFLITSLLLEERRRTGRTSLRRFYARRALRLLPALGAGIGLFGAYVVLSDKASLRGYGSMLAKVFTYSANWFIPDDRFLTTWFGQSWSLAIEEQFYIVWPVALGLLAVATRRRPQLLVGGLAVLVVGVAIWRAVLLEMNDLIWSEVYYRTDARLDQLLGGAILALVLHHGWLRDKPRPWIGAAALLLWVVLTSEAVIFEPEYYRFYSPLGVVMAVGLILGAMHARGPAAAVLGWAPIRWLGNVSYTLYIVHVFVFHAVALHMPGDGRELERFLVANALALGLTTGIHYLIEKPALSLKDRFAGHKAPATGEGSPPLAAGDTEPAVAGGT